MRSRTLAIATGLALATIASRPDAQPAPDIEKAKALYESATTAMTEGRYADAVRDFGAAYDITKDPVLFFKIGTANEKAGACETALVYFGRYLKEAKPEAKFVAATKDHVEACHGDWAKVSAAGGSGGGSGGSGTKGSAVGGANAGPNGAGPNGAGPNGAGPNGAGPNGAGPNGAGPNGAGANGSGANGSSANGAIATNPAGAGSGDQLGSGAGSDAALGSDAGSAAPLAGAGSGASEHPSRGKDAPWLMVGGALAFVTAGVVLAYSASSSEQDIRDLYAGLGNGTPTFDPKNATRYQDLVDEGHRYQYLSWASFGLAAGFGAVAAILFVRAHNEAIRDQHEHAVRITPTASPTSAGLSATLHF